MGTPAEGVRGLTPFGGEICPYGNPVVVTVFTIAFALKFLSTFCDHCCDTTGTTHEQRNFEESAA